MKHSLIKEIVNPVRQKYMERFSMVLIRKPVPLYITSTRTGYTVTALHITKN